MSLEADLLADRRRLSRRITFWRVLAVIGVIAALGALFGRDGLGGIAPNDHVLRLRIEGVITEDRRLLEVIEEASRDASARAMLLVINSPGGSMAGGEALHGALKRFAEKKPIVALMGGTAASAGYMIAMPAQHVVAREATVTGSIGVLLQSFDVSELLARLGVRPDILATGPFKAQPNPFQPLTDQGRAEMMRVLEDLHSQFIGIVAAGRRMDEARVRPLADGRVFTGRQALPLGLIDAIGGEAEARAWLAAQKGVAEDLPVRDLEPRDRVEKLLNRFVGNLAKTLISEWLGVDAPRAVWQFSR
ncbi:MAG: signal peptide peptidase SppA [Alphaproteobacteria bacterium]|nr:signal peptide peptidase SppA [Alphaproteobacteria bacterium]